MSDDTTTSTTPPPLDNRVVRERTARIRAEAEKQEAAVAAEAAQFLTAMLARASERVSDAPPATLRPCGCAPWVLGEVIPDGEETCDRIAHHVAGRDGAVVSRACPMVAVEAERKRLSGVLAQLARGGGDGLDRYDPTRHPAAARALDAMRAFADARPPRAGVVLIGPLGLGKTHLLVASHLALLMAGLTSRYLTTPELRALFRNATSYDPDTQQQAMQTLAAIRRADAVHLDDLGDVEGDERKRGEFSEQLKALRDNSTGAWAVATNCTYEEAAKHPDIGRKLLDRLIDGAVMVPMTGKSQRRPAGVLR